MTTPWKYNKGDNTVLYYEMTVTKILEGKYASLSPFHSPLSHRHRCHYHVVICCYAILSPSSLQ